MTAATDRAVVREWVGSTPVDAEVDAAVVAFADATMAPYRAALRILRMRRADNQYQSFAVDGDASWNQTTWLADLDTRIMQLRHRIGDDEAPDDGLPVMTSTAITGPGNPR